MEEKRKHYFAAQKEAIKATKEHRLRDGQAAQAKLAGKELVTERTSTYDQMRAHE